MEKLTEKIEELPFPEDHEKKAELRGVVVPMPPNSPVETDLPCASAFRLRSEYGSVLGCSPPTICTSVFHASMFLINFFRCAVSATHVIFELGMKYMLLPPECISTTPSHCGKSSELKKWASFPWSAPFSLPGNTRLKFAPSLHNLFPFRPASMEIQGMMMILLS